MTPKHIGEVLGAITYKNWWFHVGSEGGRGYLQWRFAGRRAKTGNEEMQHGRKWFLSPHMTESELVQTAFAAALAAEEHECREFFTYQGKRPFQPHISVQALLSVCDQEDARAPIGVTA